jgi:hypothetical protein
MFQKHSSKIPKLNFSIGNNRAGTTGGGGGQLAGRGPWNAGIAERVLTFFI